jgi:hypothetical protein
MGGIIAAVDGGPAWGISAAAKPIRAGELFVPGDLRLMLYPAGEAISRADCKGTFGRFERHASIHRRGDGVQDNVQMHPMRADLRYAADVLLCIRHVQKNRTGRSGACAWLE